MEQLINYLLSVLLLFNSQKVLPDTKTTIYLTGDVMLGRSVNSVSLAKNDPTYPFQKVADKLKEGDIVFSNLETPIITNCSKDNPEFKFCADPRMVEGLKFAGISVVNLANNHILNFGQAGLIETEDLLTKNGINWVGEGNLGVVTKNGIKFGFLGFDYVDYKLAKADLDLIKRSKQKVDVLIVGIHWGNEYSNVSTPVQKEIATKMFESGADVISGHHPHVVEDNETIDGKPVFYSLGNFVFDQMWSEQTRHGMVEELIFENSKLTKTYDHPIYIKSFAQPEWED